MGKIIKFPTHLRRVGNKYKQEEIERITEMLRLCDSDMSTMVYQIEQLNEELKALSVEYEALLARLQKLLEEDDGKN